MPHEGIVIREARSDDLRGIIEMLADDFLGRTRERLADEVPDSYRRAFEAIERDERNHLIVAELDGRLAATLQLTFIPSLSHGGSERLEVEAVRVASHLRGQGIGREVFRWVIERARERGCRTIQLTTNKQRVDAKRFYESLGFKATHEGMKLDL